MVADGQRMPAKWRLALSAFVLLAAAILALAASLVLYQLAGSFIRASDLLGTLLCGKGLHVGHTFGSGGSQSLRLICLDANGAETGGRNNLIAIKLAIPFFALLAVPALHFVWTADWRAVRR